MASEDLKARFTPEATIGPFYPGAFLTHLPQDLWTVAPLVAHHPQGQPIVLVARFFDSLKRPVPSLVVELWQANAHGRYRHPQDQSAAPLDPQFDGFARVRTSDEGVLRFYTIKPGAHPVRRESAEVRAPHLRLTIFASGIDRLITQLFFDDESSNQSDPVLQSIPDPRVRGRLIARRRRTSGGGEGVAEYEIDVVLRGEDETPFFDDWDG
ncbi:MAG: protocatechuate 3,4-dioxygenase subunit alpha [Acidobacteria bacterium 13_1_20CM_2_65_9]|nr:MAG: protocatechuate 3,4-dioxygenase subunit alpha [Acidobacteria bacterium 13_1_20CM_2_65_9]